MVEPSSRTYSMKRNTLMIIGGLVVAGLATTALFILDTPAEHTAVQAPAPALRKTGHDEAGENSLGHAFGEPADEVAHHTGNNADEDSKQDAGKASAPAWESLTVEEKQAFAKDLKAIFCNMTDAQKIMLNEVIRAKLASSSEYRDLMAKFRGETYGSPEQGELMNRALPGILNPAMADGVSATLLLPDKNGVVVPQPLYLIEFFSSPPPIDPDAELRVSISASWAKPGTPLENEYPEFSIKIEPASSSDASGRP